MRELISAIDRMYAGGLREVQSRLARLAPSSNCRKFLVNRMGSTGSTWLAKLLNSHPDVFCSHEGVVSRIYPAREYGNEDILKFVEMLAAETSHGAYRAIGDVGSVWTGHSAYASSFTTAILIRHPARLLATRLRVFSEDQSFAGIPPQSAEILRVIWGLDLHSYAPVDQIFLHDLLTFLSQSWAFGKVDILMRIEDLQDLDDCQRTLQALTGVHFPQPLILHATQSRVNQRLQAPQRIADIVAGFSKLQREWYGELLSEAAPLFGYDLWNDDLGAAPLIRAYPPAQGALAETAETPHTPSQ